MIPGGRTSRDAEGGGGRPVRPAVRPVVRGGGGIGGVARGGMAMSIGGIGAGPAALLGGHMAFV